jgi:Uma2 family endonuclease
MATDIASEGRLDVLPVELQPSVDHIVTEDGAPVDSIISEKQMRLLTEPLYSSLYSSWTDPQARSFVAMANVGLFFGVNFPPLVPDVLLSMDVQMPEDFQLKVNRSYFTWVYGNPPDVVIEVVSNREGGEDTAKLAAYARIHVGYYAIFDPDRLLSPELLRGYRLDGLTYRRMEEPLWFAEVGLGLRLWQGQYEDVDRTWLRWVDAKDILIPTGRERADAQEQRADAQEKRADRLAELLRQHGIEPPAP